MKKILDALGLDPKSTEDDAVKAIQTLQAASAKTAAVIKEVSNRDAKILELMRLGMQRDVATESVDNQIRQDQEQAAAANAAKAATK